MDPDSPDGLRSRESHGLPGFSGVRGFIDSGPRHRGPEDIGFSGSDPDDIRIGVGDGDIADGQGRHLFENRLPGDTAVDRFPYPPDGGRDVDGVPASLGDGDVRAPSSDDIGPYVSPFESLVRSLALEGLVLFEPFEPDSRVRAFDLLRRFGRLDRDGRDQAGRGRQDESQDKSPFHLFHV